MKPLRKNVALAIDGGGIKGVIVTRALSMLEEHLGKPVKEIFRLSAGTSTGSIISAGTAAGLSAQQMHSLYVDLGPDIFRKSWRSGLFPLTRYQYPSEPFEAALREYIGEVRMGEFWKPPLPTDVVITSFDLVENRNLFIKPWKKAYGEWPVIKAVMASSCVPTYFPVVEGRYVDGGIGAYANPSYLAAYEILFCLGWDPAETTLISLGTGRDPHFFDPGQVNRMWVWDWLTPILGAFLHSADDQQVHLVETFFQRLDFRRFQVDLETSIEMDDTGMIPQLEVYGEQLGRMLLNDQVDHAMGIVAKMAPPPGTLTHTKNEEKPYGTSYPKRRG
jgi:hypothetical protein